MTAGLPGIGIGRRILSIMRSGYAVYRNDKCFSRAQQQETLALNPNTGWLCLRYYGGILADWFIDFNGDTKSPSHG